MVPCRHGAVHAPPSRRHGGGWGGAAGGERAAPGPGRVLRRRRAARQALAARPAGRRRRHRRARGRRGGGPRGARPRRPRGRAVGRGDAPSLRGRPVVVGGTGGRGVVATASYEARAYGARSAMSTGEARRRCPAGTAFLGGRFGAYRRTSEVVMALLREISPLVEPVSIDEAYVDLAAGPGHDLSVDGATALARDP